MILLRSFLDFLHFVTPGVHCACKTPKNECVSCNERVYITSHPRQRAPVCMQTRSPSYGFVNTADSPTSMCVCSNALPSYRYVNTQDSLNVPTFSVVDLQPVLAHTATMLRGTYRSSRTHYVTLSLCHLMAAVSCLRQVLC